MPTSLSELEALCREPLLCKFNVNGKPVEIEARRLTPAEDARINLIVQKVQPKLIPGERPGEFIGDVSDPHYREEIAKAQQQARALTLWLCVPGFQTAVNAPVDLLDLPKITEYVQAWLTEDILALLYERCMVPAVPMEERVAFFTTAGSRPS
jgi:hypothetical protein